MYPFVKKHLANMRITRQLEYIPPAKAGSIGRAKKRRAAQLRCYA